MFIRNLVLNRQSLVSSTVRGILDTGGLVFPCIRLLAFLLSVLLANASLARQPNVVLIVADDLGWTDLSCQGSEYYRTPNIDALAEDGLRFSRFYVSPNCAPTRASMMSGQWAPRTGMYSVWTLARGEDWERKMLVPENQNELRLDITIVPEIFKEAGYATGMYGKWHLGNRGEYHPMRRGFDEALVVSNQHYNYRTFPETEVPENQYHADFLTDKAVDFIARHRNELFFLYLPHFAVHVPIEAKPKLESEWKKRAPAGHHWDATYAAMIQSVDESVGRIRSCLDEYRLAEDTLLIFTSDNGGVGGYRRTEPPSSEKGFTSNEPLRGGKGTFYEGGVRVPFIARWPGVIDAGMNCEEPVAHVDLLPSFASLVGVPLPSGQWVDGADITPLFRDSDEVLPERALYWHFPGYLESYVHENGFRTTPVSSIIEGDYKLLEFLETGEVELYKVVSDIGERRNLVDLEPDRAAEMLRKLHSWRDESRALMPEFKPGLVEGESVR